MVPCSAVTRPRSPGNSSCASGSGRAVRNYPDVGVVDDDLMQRRTGRSSCPPPAPVTPCPHHCALPGNGTMRRRNRLQTMARSRRTDRLRQNRRKIIVLCLCGGRRSSPTTATPMRSAIPAPRRACVEPVSKSSVTGHASDRLLASTLCPANGATEITADDRTNTPAVAATG